MRRTRLQVLAISGLALALAAIAWSAGLPVRSGPPFTPHLPWWLLVPLFAVMEIVVVRVHTPRQSSSVSLSEVPLVLALFLARPVDLLAAATLGPVVVYAVQNRQTPIKGAFNTALRVLGATAALSIFHVLAGDAAGPVDGPAGLGQLQAAPGPVPLRAWLAAVVAAVCASALDTLLVMIVVALHDRSVGVRDVARDLLTLTPIAAVVACSGLVAMSALHADPRTGVLLLVLGSAILAGYQAHSRVREQQVRLERLHAFSRTVGAAGRSEQTIRRMLEAARDYLGADSAEVVLAGGDDQGFVRAVLAGDQVVQEHLDGLPAGGPWSQVLAGDGPVLLPRHVRAGSDLGQLRALGYREAIVVPLHDGAGVVGALAVGDRPGETVTFGPADVQALQGFADQARLALQHGRLMERLAHQTTHDGLTGLPNGSAFRDTAQAALGALNDGNGAGFALLLLDLDDFAEVNTSLGYQSGDALLQQLAARLAAAVPLGSDVARVGGDEFAVLLPGVTLPEIAVSAAQALREKLSEPLVVNDVDVRVAVSVGVALAPQHAGDVTCLLRAAGSALEQARAAPARVLAYDRDLTPSGQTQLAVLADLRRALERDELAVYVQPQAHAGTGEVLGVEALVRWHHPEFGLLQPYRFLPLAQRHGLMGQLTDVVLRRATSSAAAWRRQGLDLTMAVNLDPSTLADENLPARVGALLERSGLPADRLTLEITEDSMIGDPDAGPAMLYRLRQLGVGVSVDDYGTGYASLSYLRRLPASEVKIDRSFITALATDEADLIIVRSIIDLAGNLCLRVVAEGVEDQATWDLLSDLGCDLIQGYHLARPMPIDELFGWVARHHLGLGLSRPTTPLPQQRDRRSVSARLD